MSLKSRGRDESLIICEMKQYIYTYYRSFLHWLALLSLSETSSPHHGVPHDHSVLLRHELTYRSEKNFVWFICTDHVLAPKIISHGSAWWRGQWWRTNVAVSSSHFLIFYHDTVISCHKTLISTIVLFVYSALRASPTHLSSVRFRNVLHGPHK